MRKPLLITAAFGAVLLGSMGVSYAAFSPHVPKLLYPHTVKEKMELISSRFHDWKEKIPKTIYLDQFVDLHQMKRVKDLRLIWPAATTSPPPQTGAAIAVKPLQTPPPEPVAVKESRKWTPDRDELMIEAVLVPRQVTVISSSQDGKISRVAVNQGDHFKKGDVLIEYDCSDLDAEAEIARMQKKLTSKKASGADDLFKLEILSDVERLGSQIEDRQAAARNRLYDARKEQCRIRAEFEGHVTNRLANPGEYTRTDRVLMEVASDEPLQAEFLLPSKWLRWVNIGAPLSVTIGENEITYEAKILRIYGEVDPASQSIQVVAALDPYDDPLLPGMSGQARLSVNRMEQAGIKGYLQR